MNFIKIFCFSQIAFFSLMSWSYRLIFILRTWFKIWWGRTCKEILFFVRCLLEGSNKGIFIFFICSYILVYTSIIFQLFYLQLKCLLSIWFHYSLNLWIFIYFIFSFRKNYRIPIKIDWEIKNQFLIFFL